jgi:hypothetical protein
MVGVGVAGGVLSTVNPTGAFPPRLQALSTTTERSTPQLPRSDEAARRRLTDGDTGE